MTFGLTELKSERLNKNYKLSLKRKNNQKKIKNIKLRKSIRNTQKILKNGKIQFLHNFTFSQEKKLIFKNNSKDQKNRKSYTSSNTNCSMIKNTQNMGRVIRRLVLQFGQKLTNISYQAYLVKEGFLKFTKPLIQNSFDKLH